MNPPNRLLLVEDDDELREIFARRFTRRGMHVVAHADATAALAAAMGQTFQVAILDRNLPGMDGIELMKRLKLIDARLPVVVLSGSADSKAPVLARDHGAFAYLAKPCGLAELEAVINSAITGSASTDSPP